MHSTPPASGAAKDPVCGMSVDPARAAGEHQHQGRTYYFCSRHCLEKFRAHPASYLGGAVVQLMPAAPAPAVEGAVYTCPMHPEVVQSQPGACPKCGMALEPQTVTAEEEVNPELADMQRRFWASLVLTVPVFALAMSDVLPGQPVQHALGARFITWIQLLLATPVVLWGGWPFFARGWASLVNRSLNMFTLIALGTGTAYVYSLVAALAPGIFPASFRGHGGEVAVYFEAAAVITARVLLGQVLELKARSRTASAIKALLQLAPKTARRQKFGGGAQGRRRPHPGGEGAGEPCHRRHGERHRQPRAAGRARGPRYLARPHRRNGERGAAQPRPYPAPGGRGGGLLRARGGADRGGDIHRLGDHWPGAAAGARVGERGGGAHHRLPLRARPGHPDVHHGRNGPRGAGGGAHQERPSAPNFP